MDLNKIEFRKFHRYGSNVKILYAGTDLGSAAQEKL